MSIDELPSPEQIRFEKKTHKKIKCLKKVRMLSLINRMICLASVLPLFYAAACLGQKKPVPVLSQIGSIGFIASAVSAVILKEKEEKNISDIQHLYEQYHKMKSQAI